MASSAISVKQLNFYVKSLLDCESRLQYVSVVGEISNFSNHYASGHWYFTLKDNDAAIRCVMFKSNAQKVKFLVENGMRVVVTGKVSLYENDGQYQFYAEQLSVDGMGDIAVAFEQIKQRLLKEGLFDESNKRPIPTFPKRIAVITSPTGAAVQDILSILDRRNPMCEVVMCPVSVQGEFAVHELIDALSRVYSLPSIDLIIIGRGGGSIEDLWAFNSEMLARKIYESPIPVISAVGHETDFTICDFVADFRAPTPSAAAEIAVPNIAVLKDKLEKYDLSMISALNGRYNLDKSRLSALTTSSVFKNPENILFSFIQNLDRVSEKMFNAQNIVVSAKMAEFQKIIAALDALSPLKLLKSGYSVIEKDGKTITSVNQLKSNDEIDLILSDGKIRSKII